MWYKSQNDKELEANLFAAELLLPETMFRRKLEKTIPSFELIETLAGEFQTTLTATAIRYIDLCEEQCAIVFSTNGKVIWSRRSPDFHRWITPGRKVSSYSLAADFFRGQPIGEDGYSPARRVGREHLAARKHKGTITGDAVL